MKTEPMILTPGPVAVPDFIQLAIARPVIHQRSQEFTAFFRKLQQQLQFIFQTEGPVLAFPGTGSQAMQMTMRSFLQPGDQVVIQNNGKFSDRWDDYAISLGLDTWPLKTTWGDAPEPQMVIELLGEMDDPVAVVLTHCETSTGALIDLEEIAFAIKQQFPQVFIIVDAISTVAVQPYYHDAWNIDASVCTGQKGLFNPSGTAFVALSERAMAMLNIPNFADSLHLGTYWKSLYRGSFPFTPPTQLFYGIQEALQRIQEKTLARQWNENHLFSRAFKQGVTELGGTLFGRSDSDSLTAFSLGSGTQDELRMELKERGFELAGGQGDLKGKIMRVGHFGWLSSGHVDALLQEIESLKKEGKWK